MDRTAPLAVYLNDHLAGASGGVQLFRRAAGAAEGTARTELERLAAEVEQDRASLLAIMSSLQVPVQRYKVVTGWVLERVSRLKSNGSLIRRSPLSDLVELEVLVLGVTGKAIGFKALRGLAGGSAPLDAGELDRLISRAEHQVEALERLRLQAAGRVLTPTAPQLQG